MMNATALSASTAPTNTGPSKTASANTGHERIRWIERVLGTRAGWGALVLRAPVGIILAAHGAQKLFGWFGGYGLEGTGQFMDSIGLHPGYWMALLAGSAEFIGGLALLAGLLVRPAAALIAFTMLVAIFSVHIGNGLFMSDDGYEYALTLLAVALSLLFSGAGRLSLDALVATRATDATRTIDGH